MAARNTDKKRKLDDAEAGTPAASGDTIPRMPTPWVLTHTSEAGTPSDVFINKSGVISDTLRALFVKMFAAKDRTNRARVYNFMYAHVVESHPSQDKWDGSDDFDYDVKEIATDLGFAVADIVAMHKAETTPASIPPGPRWVTLTHDEYDAYVAQNDFPLCRHVALDGWC